MSRTKQLRLSGVALVAVGFGLTAAGCGVFSSSASGPASASYSVTPYAAPKTPSSRAAVPSTSSKSPKAAHETHSGTPSKGPRGSSHASKPATGGKNTSNKLTGNNVRAPKGSPSRVYVFNRTGKTIVDAPLTPTYLDSKGVLAPPGGQAGWYAESGWARPGYNGAAILVGHITYYGHPDTFYNLIQAVPGDKIVVRYSSGQQVSFVATKSKAESKAAVPKDGTIWDNKSPVPVLRLITCNPNTAVTASGHFEGNWVVWAVPA